MQHNLTIPPTLGTNSPSSHGFACLVLETIVRQFIRVLRWIPGFHCQAECGAIQGKPATYRYSGAKRGPRKRHADLDHRTFPAAIVYERERPEGPATAQRIARKVH